MILCNTVCSASSVGAGASTNCTFGAAPVPAVQHQAMQMYEQLRGAVETWRLRIEHRRQKTRRLMVLEPAALIHQQRKTGGMALGNAVFAKPLDLP